MSVFDFSDVKEFTAVEAGTYNAKLTGYKFKNSKPSAEFPNGKPMVTLELSLEGELEGRKLWQNYTLTQAALPYVKNALVALGANPDDFTAQVDLGAMIGGLIGSGCTLEVSKSPYTNPSTKETKDTNSIDRIRRYQPSGW